MAGTGGGRDGSRHKLRPGRQPAGRTTDLSSLEHPMRSHIAARSARTARIVLAAAAGAVALTATAATAAVAGTTAPRVCATDDLTFEVTAETQAGGYDLVAATAKPGVTCTLRGVYPSASYGSSPETEVSPAQQAVSEDILLTGSKAAYAGINP
ncbi:DUF4232 domain-containing protein, partial [Streptomyces sp. TRM76130]|nr:DUF4232 domain-containing protein [Streptomyces sp. TRM76130]